MAELFRYAAALLLALLILKGGAAHAASKVLTPISWNDLEGVSVGNAQDQEAKTGVTVLLFPGGARAGVDISGGGPASRETPVLSPVTAPVPLNAIVLSGGSAYGLAASDGVMKVLERHGMGYDTGFALVPIVCGSSIYDLAYGSASVRPDAAMGAQAAEAALKASSPVSGNCGAGTGASVGKLKGMRQAMKTGIGYAALQAGSLKLGAVVVLNALGDVFDADTGEELAGMRTEDRSAFLSCAGELYRLSAPTDQFTGRTNTTLGAVVTNGDFSKAELTKVASMARNAYARCINPVGTLADGDTIYAASCGTPVRADLNMAGTLAAEAMALAIRDAALSARIPDEEFLKNCPAP